MAETFDPKVVGYRIREIRKQLGLSMTAFAEKIDSKSRSGTISNWETGKNLPNNERLKKIAELGGTTVEYLLTGKEVKDLEGNLMPEGLRLYDYEFIGHYENKLKDSPVRVFYSFIKISKEDTFYYGGIRSSVVLGSVDLNLNNAPIIVLSESLEKNEFFNSVNYIDFDFNNDKSLFVNCDNYINSKNLGDKNFRVVFLRYLLDEIFNELKEDEEIPFEDINFKGNFHYFKRGTTNTISLKIGK